ncbi:methyltransferase domain-containing protein [Streptomyces luteireticuli]|uniref:methyltransferase domain-containing protein n=1 Tax=Streptomyces luteireticuli TaxID=173858 RepID=UPI003557901F
MTLTTSHPRDGFDVLLASINLNKRLGAAGPRAGFAAWLRTHGVQAVVAQEAFKPADRTPPVLPGFAFAGGDGEMAVWISEHLAPPAVALTLPWVQRIELEWLTVLQVHLDSNSAGSRTAQLTALAEMAAAEDGRPLLVCGDFNIAPRPEDGLHNGAVSPFNTKTERAALQQLMTTASLIDTTADEAPVFTLERHHQGTQFRCDLALINDHLAPSTSVTPDATVRTKPTDFTDHSALLIDLPVTLQPAEPADVLFAFSDLNGGVTAPSSSRTLYRPHKTAMSRKSPSPASRAVTEHIIKPLGIISVLDHGCGHGTDVEHYRAHGLAADGFDPHDSFGWPRPGRHDYDLVTQMFVLNVLPDPWQRIQALKDAAAFTRPGGHLVVVTRSPEEITKAAAHGGWRTHHDGFWSSEGKGTFQRGINTGEIATLAHQAGLFPADGVPALPLPGVCHAVLLKPQV